MNQRCWLLIKALESRTSLKDALELAKQADAFLKGETQCQKDHVLAAPVSRANGGTTRAGLNSAVHVKTATLTR